VLAGLPQGVGGLAILIYINLFLLDLHNAHQVLAGLPQGVDGLAILLYLISV
jgi:hypothetical protein